jgi:phospholipid/cholesterol/gamma-HCH transport system substrate-binding protein
MSGPPDLSRWQRIRDRMSFSFSERNPMVLGGITITLIAVSVIGVLVLNADFFADRYTVNARFEDAAGIKPGDVVRVAGIDAGKVDAVRQEDGQVEVVLNIDEGVELPADTAASIQVETVLGTKFVRLTTGDDWEHPLEDGDTIIDTTTPVELTDLQNTGTRLFDESDGEALNDLMASLSQVTDGKRVQVQQILDGLTDLTRVVSDRETEARRLLDSAQTLTGTLADRDEELGSAIDNLNVVVGDLAERRTALVELLDSTSVAARELSGLIGDNRADLDAILNQVHTTLETIGDHQVDLAQSVAYLGVAIEGFASVGYNGPEEVGRPWANIFTQLIGPTGPDGLLGACMPVDRMLDLVFGPDPLPCSQRTGPIMTSPPAGSDGPPTAGDLPNLEPPAGGVDTALIGPLLASAGAEP